MRQRTRGFSIIELMIVVTVIGTLSSLAIPMYQRYATRAKIAEGLSLAHGAKTAIADYYTNNGDFPSDNESAGLDALANGGSRIVRAVQVQAGGVIVVTFDDPALLGQVITLSPDSVGSQFTWTCTTTLPPALRPKQECS